ncbi:stage II sporulation protein M [Paenibacillus albiflavus]|uniref:Stage II sporulation protein M n=1 Tax=Paenibacillus albiflavus TaxID=2545760 RepID=A0A4R4DZD1_9BACL|nr:stage II sporulation protein M [Paenibacillus albiflavus]TCZ67592.1 stage II sporulation protein M [Paenibacillus albiflavus]
MSLKALFRHFREMKIYFLVVIVLFILGVVLGTLHWNQALLDQQLKAISEIANSVDGKDSIELSLFWVILKNNVVAMLVMVVSGILFAVFPIFSIFTNGLLLGYVGEQAVQSTGLVQLAKGIIPHGVLEIPALIIACAYGLRLGVLAVQAIISLFSETRRQSFGIEAPRLMKLMVPLTGFLIGLLLVAALIESTISFWLVQG